MATGLGIDIGSENIKVVQISVSGGKVTVTGALRIPRNPSFGGSLPDLPPDAPDTGPVDAPATFNVPESLGQDLKHAKLRTKGTIGVSGRDVALKYLSSPPMPPPKLKQYIDMEVGGKLTAKASAADGPAVTYDWRLLNVPSGLSGDLVIMAGTVKNEFLFGVNAMLKRAGLEAEMVTPSCFGLVNAFLATQPVKPGETVVLIDVGHELLEIAILEENNLYFARSAPGGGKKFTQALERVLKLGNDKVRTFKHERARLYPEGDPIPNKQELTFQAALKEGAESIANAIRQSIMFCRTQAKMPKLDYSRIVLSGGGARLEGLREYLAKKTGRPVDVFDYSGSLGRLDAESAKNFENQISDMTVALGLAVIDANPQAVHFKLIPEAVIKKRNFFRKTLFGAAAGVVILASLFPPYKYASEASEKADDRVAAVQAKQTESAQSKKDFERMVEKNTVKGATVEYFARQTRSGRVYLDLYKAIRGETPQDVNLLYLGPGSEQVGIGAAPGLGAWSAVDDPIAELALRGVYKKATYTPDTKWNAAWEAMRRKLLAIPGIKDATMDLAAEIESGSADSKAFQIKITLQDLSKPLFSKEKEIVPEAPKQ